MRRAGTARSRARHRRSSPAAARGADAVTTLQPQPRATELLRYNRDDTSCCKAAPVWQAEVSACELDTAAGSKGAANANKGAANANHNGSSIAASAQRRTHGHADAVERIVEDEIRRRELRPRPHQIPGIPPPPTPPSIYSITEARCRGTRAYATAAQPLSNTWDRQLPKAVPLAQPPSSTHRIGAADPIRLPRGPPAHSGPRHAKH